MSNLLTHSRLRTWRDCKRRHRLVYLDGWRPRREDPALSFGRLAHEGLEGWWLAEPGQRLHEAVVRITGRAQDLYQEAAVQELLRGYDAKWAVEMEAYEVLAVEASFTAPLVNPRTAAASRTYLIAGKVDAVVRERATGRVLLVEHKTTSDSIEDGASTYWRRLAMDGQVSHYYVGAEALGFQVEGCLYDVLLRPGQRPKQVPVLDEDGVKIVVGSDGERVRTANGKKWRESADSAKGYVLQTRDETPQEYAERIRADIEATPEKYFQRKPVPRTEDDLRDYLFDAWAEARAIREAELAGRSPRNPEACHRFGQCPFWEACANGLRLEDAPDLFERVEDNVHPELDLTGVPS